jgi:hypothetical protein
MICQQITGTKAVNSYAPQIFKNLGIVGNKTGLFATGIYGAVKLVAVSCFLFSLQTFLDVAGNCSGRRLHRECVCSISASISALRLHWQASCARCWIRCSSLHFSLRRTLPIWLGTCLLDLCYRNPNVPPPFIEHGTSSSNSVAVQLCCLSSCPKHVGHHWSTWLWVSFHYIIAQVEY